ncbi:MAG: histidine phosphatase family protein [Pseudomonadota bacterium]
MALTLILIRHAKSAWSDPTLDDFDRPLNDRGRKSAPALANWLVRKGYLPDVVLVSGARRTVETWERMAPSMPETATMESMPALYHAGSEIILGALKAQTSPTVALIAHNPGIAEFAERIVAAAPTHREFQTYPTAATTVISFDEPNWSDINWAQGTVLDFTVPRDLIDAS